MSSFKTENWFISPFDFAEEARSKMRLPKRVELNDSTMRDGEQTIGVAYTDEEKLLIARKLDELGVGSIELSVFMKMELIDAICDLDLNSDIICMGFSGWAKNWKEVVDRGIDVGIDIVSLSHGSFYGPWGIRSREENPHIATEDDWIGSAVEVVDHVHERGVKVIITINDATRTPLESIKKLFKAVVNAGTDRIKICDTVGVAGLAGWRYLVSEVKREFPRTPLQVHIHNDFGLATANALISVEEGAEIIDTTTNGLGERAGNPPTSEVAVGAKVFYGIDTGIKLNKLFEVSRLVADLSRYPIPDNKPLVGEKVFVDGLESHAASIKYAREKGVPFMYDAIKPELVGNKRHILLSRYTGPNLLKMKLDELGIELPEKALQRIADRVQEETLIRKKILNEYELRLIIDEIVK